jgi:hypothetical protein
MKITTYLLFIVLYSTLFGQASTPILEGIQNQKINIISVKNTGGYHGKYIELKIKNNTNIEQYIEIPEGQLFDSESNSVQNLIVLKAKTKLIYPKETQTFNLNTACIQAHNAGPNTSDNFTLGNLATGFLLKIAQFIGTNDYYESSTAQSAIWAITDHYSIGNIYGDDINMAKQLAQLVSEATGQVQPKYIPQKSLNIVSIRTNIFFRPQKLTKATLGLYNLNGELIDEYFTNRTIKAGPYSFLFGINQIDSVGSSYYIRLTATNGEILINKKVNESSVEINYSIQAKRINFEYLLDKQIKGTLTVKNQAGEITKMYYTNRTLTKGGHRHSITLKYIPEVDEQLIITLKNENGNTIHQKTVELK